MRTLRITAALFLGLALPAAAFAQTTNSSAQLTSLLSELSQLQQELASVSGTAQIAATSSQIAASGSAAAAPAASIPNSCPDLTETLSVGSSGAQVVGLQTFLAQQGYFNASVTGYFGSITQSAVGQWQEKNNVVAGGDADSTGLGVVGPKTRAAIDEMCGIPVQSQCLDVQPPVAECSTGWQPVLDAAGCAMYYQCVVQIPSTVTTPAVTQTTSSSASAPVSCPVVTQPQCSGTVVPFQTDSNGCVTSYECTL